MHLTHSHRCCPITGCIQVQVSGALLEYLHLCHFIGLLLHFNYNIMLLYLFDSYNYDLIILGQ